MQVKRFFGPDAKTVIRQIHETLGEEAMILSNRSLDNGVEILCGIGADLEIDHESSQPKKSTKMNWIEDPTLMSMRKELNSLKGLLEDQLSGFAWKELKIKKPVYASLIERLIHIGFQLPMAKKMALQVEESVDLETAWNELQKRMAGVLPIVHSDLLNTAKIIALIGPSGSGKTTSLIKLASRYLISHKTDSVAVIAMDSDRVAAYEPLKVYGKLLGFTVNVLDASKSLSKMLDEVRYASLTLIDTPSCLSNRLRVMEQIKDAGNNGYVIKKLLTLSSIQNYRFSHQNALYFKQYGVDGCVLTNTDLATNLAESLDIVIESNFPINYITNGEQIPEDIHLPEASLLTKQCFELSLNKEKNYDKELLAIKLLTEAV